MLRHLLKLAWNRKRANLLLMLEVFMAFLVLFAVVGSGLYLLDLYRRPLGYDHEGVWSITMESAQGGGDAGWTLEDSQLVERLMMEVEGLEPVTAVAAGTNRPYSHRVLQTGWQQDGRQLFAQVAEATEGYAEVMGVRILKGRWFEPTDGALGWEPVVISRDLAVELFGDQDPLGRKVADDESTEDVRIIGVIEAFRNSGELSEPIAFRFTRIDLGKPRSMPIRYLLLKVAPGTTAEFEETLSERLEALAPAWSFSVNRLEAERDEVFRGILLPLALVGVVAGFLLLMVVLGLTGVMWQNVTRRTREIGLRRAVGATRGSIHRQVVAEVMVTAGFGLLLGIVLVIQLPALEPMAFMPFAVVLSATVVSAALMLLLAAACGLYPGWSATRIEPAEALHYE